MLNLPRLKNLQMLETNFTPFPEINTERLLLRKITKDDAPAILKLRSDERVMQYIDREMACNIADAEIFINRISTSLDTNEGINWGIALKETPDILIGSIGYWRIIKEHYRAEIGYILSLDYWKKGIMKEAMMAIIEVGFKSIQLHSIEAHINPLNTASSLILVSAGFIKEAYFKENFFYKGTFRDTEIYSLLNN